MFISAEPGPFAPDYEEPAFKDGRFTLNTVARPVCHSGVHAKASN